ncbi:MAG TPA: DUF1292 domain-containing protein [Limnochordia bacterium]
MDGTATKPEADEELDGEPIVLVDEEGQTHRFALWDVVEIEERRYALLIPEGSKDDEAFVFRYEKRAGDDLLLPVEEESELRQVIEFLEREAGDEISTPHDRPAKE